MTVEECPFPEVRPLHPLSFSIQPLCDSTNQYATMKPARYVSENCEKIAYLTEGYLWLSRRDGKTGLTALSKLRIH